MEQPWMEVMERVVDMVTAVPCFKPRHKKTDTPPTAVNGSCGFSTLGV
jgi:hypothetical protein